MFNLRRKKYFWMKLCEDLPQTLLLHFHKYIPRVSWFSLRNSTSLTVTPSISFHCSVLQVFWHISCCIHSTVTAPSTYTMCRWISTGVKFLFSCDAVLIGSTFMSCAKRLTTFWVCYISQFMHLPFLHPVVSLLVL